MNGIYQVLFEFRPDDIIETPLGAKGLITNAMVDSSKTKQYFVIEGNGNGNWYREDQLKPGK